MDIKYISFVPHSDVGINETDIIEQHNELISNGDYDGATALLNDQDFNKGARASLFNSLQDKLRELQLYFLNNYVAEKDEYYSIQEPDAEFMSTNGYKFWIDPFGLGGI